MRYFTSDGEIEKKPKYYTRKEEEKMENIKLKKRGAAIALLVLALTLALLALSWLYTDFAYGDDGDGTTTNTEAVNNDNGDGGEDTPAPAQSNDTDNNQAVQVQQTEPEGNDVQSVETPTVDQDTDQGTPQLRSPAMSKMSNPQPMIKYVRTEMYFATSFGSAQGSIASLDTTSSGGAIPLDRAFLVAFAWQPEWGHNINPDNPREAMEFTGEITDDFGHTFYEGDAVDTNEVIRELTEAGVNSTYATYKLYAQYVTRVVPDVAKVIGIDGVDSGSFTEEYTGDWTYKMWFYGNKNERYVGDFTLPEPGEVDGYTFLYWDRNGDEYYPGDQLTLSSYDFDEDGCLYFTAVWKDADGNIVTELPEKPEEPDTPDDPDDPVIDPDDEDVDDEDADEDAEFETIYTETIEVNTEANVESKAEANEEVTSVDSPETGDGHPILGWIIIFCLGLSGILGGVFRKKN